MPPKKTVQQKSDNMESETQDLRVEFIEANETIQILQDRVKQLENENSSLIQKVQNHEIIRDQDRENIRAAFQRNLNDKDSLLEELRDEVSQLRENVDFRDAELRRLRQAQQMKKYDVPLPQQVSFDGGSSYMAFMRQFTSLAQACRWDEKEKAFRLLSSLRGEAADFVFSQVSAEDQRSYRIIEQALESRFLERRSTASYLAELENLKLQSREKLVEYVSDIKRLVRNGYPTADDITLNTICLRYFIKGLGDSHMALAVGMKDPKTIEDAREILETYYSLRDETKAPKVRMLRQPHQDQKFVSEAQFNKFKREFTEAMESKLEEIIKMIKSENLESRPVPQNQKRDTEIKTPPERGFKKRDLSWVECYKCRNLGHYAKDCPGNTQEQNAQGNW